MDNIVLRVKAASNGEKSRTKIKVLIVEIFYNERKLKFGS